MSTMASVSQATPRPSLSFSTTTPAIGQTWNPFVDHTTFLPTATSDFFVVSGPNQFVDIPIPPYGVLLCNSPWIVTKNVLAGQPFNFKIPFNCNFVGVTFSAQAASFDATTILVTNAIDCTIGTF